MNKPTVFRRRLSIFAPALLLLITSIVLTYSFVLAAILAVATGFAINTVEKSLRIN
jgi:hypothetical protein